MSALIPRPTLFVTRRAVRRPFVAPFAEFDSLARAAFGPAVVRPRTVRAPRPVAGFSPAAEVNRHGDDAVVRIEVPGIDIEKDLVVEVRDGQLAVRGERRDEGASEQAGRSVREVRYGSFRRSFALPEHVTAEAITATYDAGVLSIRVAGAYAGPAETEPAAVTVPVTAAAATPGATVDEAGAEQASEPAGEQPEQETAA